MFHGVKDTMDGLNFERQDAHRAKFPFWKRKEITPGTQSNLCFDGSHVRTLKYTGLISFAVRNNRQLAALQVAVCFTAQIRGHLNYIFQYHTLAQ